MRRTVRRCLWGERGEIGWVHGAGCGLPVPGASRVLVGAGGLVGGQMIVCGGRFRCPVCLPLQWDLVAGDLLWWVGEWVAGGGVVGLWTGTVSHRRSDSVGGLLGLVRAGLAGVKSVRPRRGVVGTFSMVEAKWAPWSGWSPHVHSLVFAESEDAFESFAVRAGRGWIRGVEGAGGRRVSRRRGVDGRVWAEVPAHAVAYLSPDSPHHPDNDCTSSLHEGCPLCDPDNQDLATWGGNGTGRGLDVWSHLGRLAVRGDKLATALVCDWVRGTQGFRRWTDPGRYLRERIGVPPERVEARLRERPEGGMYIDSGLMRSLEIRDRSAGGVLSGDRLVEPQALAADLADRVGEAVEVGVAEDGLPLLRARS